MKKNELINKIVLFAIAILFAIALFKYNVGIPCVFNKITGLYCPGCGTTRAIYSLIQLDLYQAFRYNMLVIALLPFAIGLIIYKYALKGQKEIPNDIWYLIIAVAILFGILRNIPFFSYLAPISI